MQCAVILVLSAPLAHLTHKFYILKFLFIKILIIDKFELVFIYEYQKLYWYFDQLTPFNIVLYTFLMKYF